MDDSELLNVKYGESIHYYASGKVLHGNPHYPEELQGDIENVFATK